MKQIWKAKHCIWNLILCLPVFWFRFYCLLPSMFYFWRVRFTCCSADPINNALLIWNSSTFLFRTPFELWKVAFTGYFPQEVCIKCLAFSLFLLSFFFLSLFFVFWVTFLIHGAFMWKCKSCTVWEVQGKVLSVSSSSIDWQVKGKYCLLSVVVLTDKSVFLIVLLLH